MPSSAVTVMVMLLAPSARVNWIPPVSVSASGGSNASLARSLLGSAFTVATPTFASTAAV